MNQVGKAAAGDPGLLDPVDPEWGADLFYPQFRSLQDRPDEGVVRLVGLGIDDPNDPVPARFAMLAVGIERHAVHPPGTCGACMLHKKPLQKRPQVPMTQPVFRQQVIARKRKDDSRRDKKFLFKPAIQHATPAYPSRFGNPYRMPSGRRPSKTHESTENLASC